MRLFKISIVFLFAILFIWVTFFQTTYQTVQGQSGGETPSTPTGVSASNGDYINKVGINWDTIRGATSYRIFRNTTNNSQTATDVGTTAANYFFDSNAPINQTLFYWVRAENSLGTSELSQSAQGLRRNGNVNGPVPPLEPPPTPNGNPVTATKAYLGKVLFWEEQMSSTRTVSCGTCHINGKGGSDPRTVINDLASTNPGADGLFGTPDDVFSSPGVPLSLVDGSYQWSASYGIGTQSTTRKTNSSVNAGYLNLLFWDGRASNVFRDPLTNSIILNDDGALESQAAIPPTSEIEMAHSGRNWTQTASQISNSTPLALSPNIPSALEAWINGRTYSELFMEAFGTPEVTPSRIAMAIATYERTLFSDRTPFDRFVSGSNTLTAAEQRGRNVFNTTTCNLCHGGSRQTNDAFIYIGVRPPNEDLGRFAETGQNGDRGSFKVPSLRNVELRAPYMHNGRFETLEDVIAFYNRGGDFNAPNKAPAIQPLGLSAQQQTDLAAYLRRPFTDERVKNETGPFDRPTLYTESNRVPTVSGSGRAGTGGNVPQVIAIEPPFVGNPSFTVAVSNALPNSQAVLVVGNSDPGVGNSIPSGGSFARETITLSNNGTGIGFGSTSLSIPDNSALVGQTFFGRWYVNDASAANGFSVSQVFRFTIFGEATTTSNRSTFVDFDGDRKTDISIFRQTQGEWWYLNSSNGGNSAFQFGVGTDKIVPADYTGDGKTDVAFWRPSSGEWFILRSEDNSFYSFPFGANGDKPAPGDFDGDGKADPAVFRESSGTWFIQASTEGTLIQPFGSQGDIPQIGDYDGDGKDDLAIFRPGGTNGGEWWINRSTEGLFATQFGVSNDKPVASDFTGDGKTDIAFWRPASGEWFVLRSEDLSFYAVPFGISSDIPAPGDYDGDGKTDTAVYRPSNGNWFIDRSTAGTQIINFGVNGDYPVPAAYIP